MTSPRTEDMTLLANFSEELGNKQTNKHTQILIVWNYCTNIVSK